MTRTLFATLFLTLSCPAAQACWQMVDPGAFASDCPIIVRGTIVKVVEAARGQLRADDLADIKVAGIVRHELRDVPLKVGDVLTVRMISRNNTQRVSTDLNYPIGTEATWLVVLNDKGEFRIDAHPVQKQPKDAKGLGHELGRVVEAVKQGEAPKDGRPTKAQWIVKVREKEARRAAEIARYEAERKEIRDIARGLAEPDGGFQRFRLAPQHVRRGVFQLRNGDQPMKGDRLVDVVELVLRDDPDANVRIFAASCLGYDENKQTAGKRAGEVLVKALSDRSPDVRKFACQTLWQRGETTRAAAVIALLKDDDAEVRSMAVTTLKRLGDVGPIEARPAVPVLMTLLVPELTRAVEMLKKKQGDDTYPFLCEILEKQTGRKHGTDASAWLDWWEDARADYKAVPLKADRAAVRAMCGQYEKLTSRPMR